jgi:hypothetical protein
MRQLLAAHGTRPHDDRGIVGDGDGGLLPNQSLMRVFLPVSYLSAAPLPHYASYLGCTPLGTSTVWRN